MLIWDEGKRAANIIKHGLDFAEARAFEWRSAVVGTDDRFEYGEERQIAIGFIGARLHVLIFTQRGPAIRIISLRKANDREERTYANARET